MERSDSAARDLRSASGFTLRQARQKSTALTRSADGGVGEGVHGPVHDPDTDPEAYQKKATLQKSTTATLLSGKSGLLGRTTPVGISGKTGRKTGESLFAAADDDCGGSSSGGVGSVKGSRSTSGGTHLEEDSL